MFLFLVAVATALCISATCSLLEATLLSVTPSQVAELSARRPRVGAIWRRFKQDIERPIAVILILNTAAHTIGASVAGAEFERLWGEEWLIAFSLLFTYLMLQFTEILPKTLGVAHRARLAPLIARPLAALERVLAPVLRFIHFVNRPFEKRERQPDHVMAVGEIRTLARAAGVTGAINPQQARLIRAALRLPELRIRQIMTPRTEVAFLTLGQSLQHILQVIQAVPYTRMPLCDRDIDHVVGMIHTRDLFNHLKLMPGKLRFADERGEAVAILGNLPGAAMHVIGSGDIDLRQIKRNVLVEPETLAVAELLRRFQSSRIHMAVVVDEHGATLGVVTLEDVLEEMVGEIEDELDQLDEGEPFMESGEGYRAKGRIGLHELGDSLGISIEEPDVDTLGGYFMKKLGRLPELGDQLRIGPFEARVLTMDGRRIGTVEFTRLQDGQSQAEVIP